MRETYRNPFLALGVTFSLVCAPVALLLLAARADAVEIRPPQTGGEYQFHVRTADSAADNADTASFELVVTEPALEPRILCVDLGPGQAVRGTFPLAPSTDGSAKVVHGFSYSLPGCEGERSAASADAYRVVFIGPLPPLVLDPALP